MSSKRPYDSEENAIIALIPYLKMICKGRWYNMEPEDRLPEAVGFSVLFIRKYPITENFVTNFNLLLKEYMDNLNRQLPSRFNRPEISPDNIHISDDGKGNYTGYDIIESSETDYSVVSVNSFLSSLQNEDRQLIADFIEETDTNTILEKYNITECELNIKRERLYKQFLNGSWFGY